VPSLNADGSTSLKPRNADLADQVVFDLQSYFAQLLMRYPAAGVKVAQDAAVAAQKAAQDAAEKAAQVTRKKPGK
jgi:hypothetical protein